MAKKAPRVWNLTPFTPGEWEAAFLQEEKRFPSVYIGPELPYHDHSGRFRARITINEGPTPEDVARGTGFGTTMETARANARLIAAAPPMLRALIRADALIENLFETVPWGKTANTDFALLNEVPMEVIAAIKATGAKVEPRK